MPGEPASRAIAKNLDLCARRDLGGLEHLSLQAGPGAVVARLEVRPRRLNDEVNVSGLPTRVRPETHVDLIRFRELAHACRRGSQQWPHGDYFFFVQIGDAETVSQRLDQQGPDPERTHAVFDDPARGAVDPASDELALAAAELACKATKSHSPLRRLRSGALLAQYDTLPTARVILPRHELRAKTMSFEQRISARGLLLSPKGRTLLLQMHLPWLGEVWMIPGGGREAGETLKAAAARELREETGLRDATIGPLLWWRTIRIQFEVREMRVLEHIFLVRADEFEPAGCELTAEEAGWLRGYRWWSAEEIRHSKEHFAPPELGELLEELVKQGPRATKRISSRHHPAQSFT